MSHTAYTTSKRTYTVNQLEHCFDELAVFKCESSEADRHCALMEVKSTLYQLPSFPSELKHRVALLFVKYRIKTLTAEQLHDELEQHINTLYNLVYSEPV